VVVVIVIAAVVVVVVVVVMIVFVVVVVVVVVVVELPRPGPQGSIVVISWPFSHHLIKTDRDQEIIKTVMMEQIFACDAW